MDKSGRPPLDANQVGYDATVARQTERYQQPPSKMKKVLIILFFVIAIILVLVVLGIWYWYTGKINTLLN